MKKNKICHFLIFANCLISLFFVGCNNSTPVSNPTYTITWKNYDGTVLEVDTEQKEGIIPTYDGAAPQKDGDMVHSYVFSGWSPNISAVKRDTIYIAQFTEKTNCYSIFWANYDGSIIKTDSVEYGSLPHYSGETPTKPCSESEYQYDFIGWTPTVVPVTGNALYTAKYEKGPRKYTITWTNYDGSVLEVDKNVEKGATPSYDGSVPYRPSTKYDDYEFSGWSPNIEPVVADIVYIAQYKSLIVGRCRYELNQDGNSYKVCGHYEGYVNYEIFSEYNNKPVTSIGNGAFRDASIDSIIIPNGITSIESYAFYSASIDSIIIPNSVETIGESAFEKCKILNFEFENTDKIKSIEKNTFCSSTLQKINLPNSLLTIGPGAFSQSSLSSIIIHDGVKTIGDFAFNNCPLSSIIIPNSVETIGEDAFSNCPLSSIIIPNSVETIGNEAFGGCHQLSSITIGKHSNLKKIGRYAFHGHCCRDFYIPSKVSIIGSGAFAGSNLESIKVSENNTIFDSRDNCNAVISTSENILVQGCSKTIIPDGIVGISSDAFSFYNLASIEIPNSVNYLGSDAFAFSKLISITIPNSVAEMHSDVFYGSSSLTYVDLTNVDHVITCKKSSSGLFYGTNINNGGIKVKNELVSSYKADAGWSQYSKYIYSD